MTAAAGRARPHALILSGSVGKGHDTVAEACAEALQTIGVETDTVDCMHMLGPISGRISDGVFRSLIAVPGLYDAFHFTQLRGGTGLVDAMDRAASAKLAEPLRRLVEDRSAELIISVFATGAGAVDRLKRFGMPRLRSIVYCTDAVPHRLWVHPNTDLFLVTDQVSAAFVRSHRPDAQIRVIPAAARPEFDSVPSRADARDGLGVPAGATCALLMAGSWGLARLDRIADALAADGFVVLAVAGTNQRLAKRLRALAASRRGLVAFGFTPRIPELMSAADVVITTPGDTCTEARLLGRPLLLLDTIPGHGRENLQLELTRGRVAATVSRPSTVVAAARRLLQEVASAPPTPHVGGREWRQAFIAAISSERLPTTIGRAVAEGPPPARPRRERPAASASPKKRRSGSQ